jgi:hypothetical protein
MNSQNSLRFVEKVFQSQPAIRADFGRNRLFDPETYHAFLDRMKGDTPGYRCGLKVVGKSFEGRPIRLVTLGTGDVPVLLWTQMHGDESTATAAVADILLYIQSHAGDKEIETILSSLTLQFLPLLNPDGAVRRQRRTAQNIDMNRDALALQTPEAILLKQVQQSLKPAFGFNLHDQELSTAGSSRDLTAIALLAPAFDEGKSDNDVRMRAKHLVSAFAESMNLFVKGKIVKYDDAFEPRAFGDNIQRWGTSTILVESGHCKSDPQKEFIRRINVTGLLSSLFSIATGEYLQSDMKSYTSLPFNSKKAYDLIVRNVTVEPDAGRTFRVDLGISSQVDTHSEPPPKLVDMGDLSTFVGWEELDGEGVIISQANLRLGAPIELPILKRL